MADGVVERDGVLDDPYRNRAAFKNIARSAVGAAAAAEYRRYLNMTSKHPIHAKAKGLACLSRPKGQCLLEELPRLLTILTLPVSLLLVAQYSVLLGLNLP